MSEQQSEDPRVARVLVCGGRDYRNAAKVNRTLAKRNPGLIITGGASGADAEAGAWAKANGVPLMVFPAQWDYYGRSAGPTRNEWMLKYGAPDVVVAFPGGVGTADMVFRAMLKGVPVEEIT